MVKCTVCKKEIVGSAPILVSINGTSYPLCSSLCHGRFEKEPGNFIEKRGEKKSWLGRRRKQ